MHASVLKPLFHSLLFSLVLLCTAAVAEEKPQYEKHSATALISASVYDELVKAQEAQENGDTATAISVLDGLKNRSGRKALKPYELAQMWNFYAYAYLADENYSDAIRAFSNLLAQDELPAQLISSTQYTLAQLYFAEGNVKKAIQLLETWFKTADNPSPDAYVMLAQMYLQEEQIDKALKQLLTAFDVAKAQNRAEKENWYALLQYVYAEKAQYKNQLKVLEILVNRWPKRNYWLALMGSYAELGMDKQQLASMDAAYQQGMLDQENYLISYAQMLMANQQPYQAAKVMQRGLDNKQITADVKNLERIGEYYRRAQETQKAIPYLEQAAAASDNGEIALRLAYVYMNRYLYNEAAASVQTALKKGGLKKPVDAQFLLGQAQFHAGAFEAARSSLAAVVKAAKQGEDERLFKQASQWLRFIDSEIKRQKEIKAYLQG